jgi:hypothetical protein
MTVFFKNHQWQVTNNGLETVAELIDSHIPHSRLLNLRTAGSELLYEWPLHMAEKTWLDYGAFEEAYRMALQHPSRPADFNSDCLEKSINKGRAISQGGRSQSPD